MQHTTINWQPYLSNNTVELVPLTENDFDIVYQAASDPLIWGQHPTPDRYKEDVFRETFFKSAVESQTAFVIKDRATGEVIGSTRFYEYDEQRSSVAIGFTFYARKYWGGVYNKMIKTLMIDYAFQFVDNIILHIGAFNIRSQKGTMKLGAKKTGEFYKESATGRSFNFEYTIEKKDWMKTV